MVTRFTLCDSNRLKLALAGDLPEAALGELSRHLQTCPHCQSELETLSGGERWASDARHYLSSSDELVAVQEMTPPAGLPPLHSPNFSAANFSARHSSDEDAALDLDFLSPSDDPAKLGRLGSYEIESVIGRGGFGIVLKALDPNLNRYVAIKALSGTLVRSSAARKRFNQEAKAAAGVVHDHVIPIHLIETSGPAPYLVMPFVTGRSLQERIDELGPLETKEVLRIAMQTAQGLAAAHAQGLVHRDVKPANILLENGVERVRITDFGLARAVDDASQTQSGYIAGTPQYMAPEQARGESIDARADLFSLGSVIYAMCTGRPPFRAETTLAVLRRICDDEPRPLREINPEVPSWLAAIALKLLAKNPSERFQSAEDVAEILGKWLAHLQQPTTIPPPVVVGKPRAQRENVGRWLLGSAAAIVAGMVVVGGLYAWLSGPGEQNREQRLEVGGQRSQVTPLPSLNPGPTASLSPEIAEASRSDRAGGQWIDQELQQLSQHMQSLESALAPPPGDELASQIDQIQDTVIRLESEVNFPPSPIESSPPPVRPD